MTFALAAYRGNISYISLHKIHIRPLRGGRPRTIVRVASRDIRADAEGEAVTGWRCLSCVVCTIFEIR